MKAICLLTLLLMLPACSPPASGLSTTTPATRAPTQASTPTVPSQEPPLVFFTSEPGKFQVWLPVSESVQEYTLNKTLFGEPIECPTINFRLNGAYAAVQYCDLVPESTASLSKDEILDQARSEILRGIDVKLEVQERMVVQEIYPALALSGPVDMRGLGYDGTLKSRIILAGDRMYFIVMSVYQEDWCQCLQQIDDVVDSLYIEPGLSIPFEPAP